MVLHYGFNVNQYLYGNHDPHRKEKCSTLATQASSALPKPSPNHCYRGLFLPSAYEHQTGGQSAAAQLGSAACWPTVAGDCTLALSGPFTGRQGQGHAGQQGSAAALSCACHRHTAAAPSPAAICPLHGEVTLWYHRDLEIVQHDFTLATSVWAATLLHTAGMQPGTLGA
jgi:hypothetical protein